MPDSSIQPPPHANYVAGEWTPSHSGGTYEKRNPWRPSELVGSFPASDETDVDVAASAAVEASSEWSEMPAAQRGAILLKAADEIDRRAEAIGQDMTREMGKPMRESTPEAHRVANVFRYFGAEGWSEKGRVYEQSADGSAIYALRRPVGPVALITPWNFPALIPAWKAAPALAYGNTVVIKPSEEAPLTVLHLAAALDAAGIPPGVFNVMLGDGPQAGMALVRHPGIKAVSFTGSTEVGHQVRDTATGLGKAVQLEMGGQSPLIVLPDANVEDAVEATFAGAFWSAGQKCMSTRRIFVHDDAYNEFRSALIARIEQAAVGDPSDPRTEVGPMVNERLLENALAAVKRGRDEGGKLLTGGARVDETAYLMAPTLIENLADDAYLSCHEVFGPLAAIYDFDTVDEAIDRANAVDFGLSASIFTRDANAIRRFVDGIQAGVLRINSQTVGAEAHVPFGGLKESGYGPREQGGAALEFYTNLITVYDAPRSASRS